MSLYRERGVQDLEKRHGKQQAIAVDEHDGNDEPRQPSLVTTHPLFHQLDPAS